jgi:hypothetical protein
VGPKLPPGGVEKLLLRSAPLARTTGGRGISGCVPVLMRNWQRTGLRSLETAVTAEGGRGRAQTTRCIVQIWRHHERERVHMGMEAVCAQRY